MSLASPEKVLVTGGGGFLGTAICRALCLQGYKVTSFSRSHYPHLSPLGVEQVQGDLSSGEGLDKAIAGCDSVVHTAAKAGIWGRRSDFYSINVVGTERVLAAAQKHGLKKLVYTSSPSVVFAGDDIKGQDESLPYAPHFLAPYPETKQLAEAQVLAAHGQAGLATVALRPHLIWGPGDPHFLPRLGQQAARGKLRRVGRGGNRVDVIYVDNAAHAHVLALAHLNLQAPHGGKAYFLGQEQEVDLWAFVDQLLAAIGMPAVKQHLPFVLAYMAGGLLERLYGGRGRWQSEPPMTRFLALQLAKSHYFSHANAAHDFGYRPLISTAEGLARLHAASVL